MWLLNTRTLKLENFVGDKDVPAYAVLSHCWGKPSEELSFGDVIGQDGYRAGYHKVVNFCQKAKKRRFRYVWVDTCCIDKKSSAELSEAINSMYSWYEGASICYIHLHDVWKRKDLDQSKWFLRGWTLQELLAPKKAYFFNRNWQPIASRNVLAPKIEKITGIPRRALREFNRDEFCTGEKMSWAANRDTTRREDRAYCLLGLFDVNMALLYGEGNKAFQRLQEEIMKVSSDMSIFLWQGEQSPSNGMLAASPQDFNNVPERLKHPIFRGYFNVSQGWTINNAGMRVKLLLSPYLLGTDLEAIFLAYLHQPFRSTEYGIFIERLEGSALEVPSYRRVAVDNELWTDDRRRVMDHTGGFVEEVFITREPFVRHIVDGNRGCYVNFRLTESLRIRKATIVNPERALKMSLAEDVLHTTHASCCFDVGPRATVGLMGQIVITVEDRVEVSVCFGYDNHLNAICIVLPFCTSLYNRGITADDLLKQYHLLREDEDEENGDLECQFFTLSTTYLTDSGFQRTHLHDRGFQLSLEKVVDARGRFTAELEFDAEQFRTHYLAWNIGSASDNHFENAIHIQNAIDVSRQQNRFFGAT